MKVLFFQAVDCGAACCVTNKRSTWTEAQSWPCDCGREDRRREDRPAELEGSARSSGVERRSNQRNRTLLARATGSAKDVVRVVLGVRLRGLRLQPLHVGGVGRVPPLRPPRLLRPLRRLPRPLLAAPPVRHASPKAHTMYVRPPRPLPSFSPGSSSLRGSLAVTPTPISRVGRSVWIPYPQFRWCYWLWRSVQDWPCSVCDWKLVGEFVSRCVLVPVLANPLCAGPHPRYQF
jgi:hypothetical protein